MPHLKHSSKEDATVTLDLDPSFTGILRGVAHDESEGCTVQGNCVVKVVKTIKVRRFVVWLEGRCKVSLKANGYSVSNMEGTESRTLYSRDQRFLGEDGQTTILTPGEYVYPFRFDLPATLPASFRGKRGYVRYRLQASLYRPMFTSDIQASRDIPIKRCLLQDSTTAMTDIRETFQGVHNSHKMTYSATAPSISYREGGLIRLNVAMQLKNPDTQSVRAVTCALRERVQYRTTDGNSNTVLSKTENNFPLGYSTFYPNQEKNYDPKDKADYNALFRLCPRVNADLNSRLMKVSHTLVVNIMVEDTKSDDEYESAYETDATESEWASEDERQSTDTKRSDANMITPPASAPSSPVLSRSSSTSSLASIFSLGRSSHANQSTDDLASLSGNMTSMPNLKSSRRKHKQSKYSNEPSLSVCSLEVPLVITSREHTWTAKPNPPSYEALEEPPSYNTSLQSLPPAPSYIDASPSGSEADLHSLHRVNTNNRATVAN
ncbi:hypothetical protein K501DRAFT_287315 [Backusella circina FSU 941]|nr:hypothetical protein K501DRAFT_287315 [Backusella circina FSU 941]